MLIDQPAQHLVQGNLSYLGFLVTNPDVLP